MTEALFTRFTNATGPLSKTLTLDSDGRLVKKAAAQMHRGQFETLRLDLTAPHAGKHLADMLTGWTDSQALSPSTCRTADAGSIVLQRELGRQPGSFARDKAHFSYRPGTPGLLVLDYDPAAAGRPLTPEELWNTTLSLWPELGQGIVVHWHSASAMIFHGDQQVTGVAGQRLYVVVADQADIPRAVKVLNLRAWLRGLGMVHVSAAGAMLPRSLFDAAMADAGGRLDFAPAGSVCHDGLEQRRGPPSVLADGTATDTHTTLPDLSSAEDAEVKALIEAAKVKAEPHAQTVRDGWLVEREQGAAVAAVKAGDSPDEARTRVRREHEALLNGVLLGGAEVVHVDDDGAEVATTVETMLRNPQAWHGKRFLSPHEPDHRGRSPDAIAYTLQAQPVIFDLNDSVTYRLMPQPSRLQVLQGNRAQLADQIASALVLRPDIVNVGGSLCRVVEGEFSPVTKPMLCFLVGTHVALFRRTREGGSSPVDIDQQTLDMVHALLAERARKVTGRASIPLIDSTGRVVIRSGLDSATGIYLDLDTDCLPIPDNPTRADVVAAVKRIWKPWSLYGWTTAHDRAAMLAAVLTVPLRPTIAAAPGLVVEAASQAAGKSSAIAAVAVLAQGHRGNLKSWTQDSEAELEKYLLGLARSGAAVVAFDNLLGLFDSATMSTAIIEGRVSGRLLGQNTTLSQPLRAVWLASGNNAALGRDLGTRFMQARIACADGKPHHKSFPFEPSDAASADRQGIVRAIITVHLAWHAAGCPQPPDGIATRFPAWGRTVRALVLWLQSSGLGQEAGLGTLGDPADSILNRDSATDPDTESSGALLDAIAAKIGSGVPFTARDLWRLTKASRDSLSADGADLWSAVSAFFPRLSQVPSVQALSSVLKNRRDRVCDGFKLVLVPKPETAPGQRSGALFVVVEV